MQRNKPEESVEITTTFTSIPFTEYIKRCLLVILRDQSPDLSPFRASTCPVPVVGCSRLYQQCFDNHQNKDHLMDSHFQELHSLLAQVPNIGSYA